jgi:hypothetical protein
MPRVAEIITLIGSQAARNKQMLHSRFFDRTRSQALVKDMLSRAVAVARLNALATRTRRE